jgi:hypothetical protein
MLAGSGAIFRGEFRQDKPIGNALFFTLPNEVVEGKFDGFKLADGHVKILYRNGDFYDGKIKNNQRQGPGTLRYRNGDIYQGNFDQDVRSGPGKLLQADGAVLECTFHSDVPCGKVVFTDCYGNRFQTEEVGGSSREHEEIGISLQNGKFVMGRFTNYCSIQYLNGDRFVGQLKQGRPSGQGILYYNSSLLNAAHGVEEAKYVGCFSAGKREGLGSLIWKDNTVFKGRFSSNRRQEGEMLFTNGMRYCGSFLQDKLHGKARMYLPGSFIIFEGEFQEGVCSGVGLLLYPNGNVYFGQH